MTEHSIDGVPLTKMRVAELKEELKARGLANTGRKDELITRLTSYMEVNGPDAKEHESSENAGIEDEDKKDQEGEKSRREKEKAESDRLEKQRLDDEEKERKEKEKLEEEKKEKAEKQRLADEEEKKEKERLEKQRLADEEAERKEKAATQKKEEEEKERVKKQKLLDEEIARKEKENAEKQEEEKKRLAAEAKEEERIKAKAAEEQKLKEEKRSKVLAEAKEQAKLKEEQRVKEDKLKREEQKKLAEEKAREEEHKRKKEKEEQKVRDERRQKDREERKSKDEKRQKDRQRRFEEDQKVEDERKAKSLAERKTKDDEPESKRSVVNGKSSTNYDESNKKADNEEEALDFEPEAPPDDTLVMEVDQHDLVEDEREAIMAAKPGEVTSLRKLGGNKANSSTGERKRGWGAGKGRLGSTDHVDISSNTLKDLVPDPKPLLSTEAQVGSPSVDLDLDADVAGPKAPKAANEPPKKRKKTEEDLNETEVILITNLTRPFTVNQLKEMLKRTGTIVDFWIDRIKSKCCVEFSSSDQASETRMALNGVTWPQGNPKTLKVSFSSKEDMKKMQEGVNDGVSGRLGAETEGRIGVLRDWDKNKLDQEKERDRERERGRSVKEVREREKSEDKSVVVTKSLEDLFNKTTAGPAIYWRPLTEEEIDVKIKERNMKIE